MTDAELVAIIGDAIVDGINAWKKNDDKAMSNAIGDAVTRIKAKAIEARRAETVKQGSVEDESAASEAGLPKGE